MQRNKAIQDSNIPGMDIEIYESEKMLKRAEEVARFGSWEIFLNTHIVKASEGAKRIYGLSGEEFTLKQVQKIPLPEYRRDLDKALKNLIKKSDTI